MDEGDLLTHCSRAGSLLGLVCVDVEVDQIPVFSRGFEALHLTGDAPGQAAQSSAGLTSNGAGDCILQESLCGRDTNGCAG